MFWNGESLFFLPLQRIRLWQDFFPVLGKCPLWSKTHTHTHTHTEPCRFVLVVFLDSITRSGRSLEKGMETFSILAWRIPWTEGHTGKKWILPIQEVTKKIRVGLTKFACIDFSAPDSPPLVVRMSSFLLVQGKYFSCGTSSSSFQKEKESQSVLIPAISSRL